MQISALKLNSGYEMPILGLGTWEAPQNKVGEAVEYAIKNCGYRHIDCAAIYGNEKEIGESFAKIFKAGVKREEIFVTSKLWDDKHAYADVGLACKKTLKDLQIDYLDLCLIHFGIAEKKIVSIRETWEAMQELVKTGLVKSIGVANFTAPMIMDLISYAQIFPAVNQIELHPYLQQNRLIKFLQEQAIAVTAYSPLGRAGEIKNENEILVNDSALKDVASNHGKTPTQILIRWAIERNTIVIPKSINPEHIKSNSEVFDFKLSSDEMKKISGLDRKLRFVDPFEWSGIPYFD